MVGNRPYFYVLDGVTPVPVSEFLERNKRLKIDEVGEVTVSTVFLGVDHNWSDVGPPVLFETMIFGGEHDEYQQRYSSYADALAGHERAVDLVKQSQHDR